MMVRQTLIHLRPCLCQAMPFCASAVTPNQSVAKTISGHVSAAYYKYQPSLMMFGEIAVNLWPNFAPGQCTFFFFTGGTLWKHIAFT